MPPMDLLNLNISNLRLQVRLRELGPGVVRDVARAFAPFVRSDGEAPHETLEVVKAGVPILKRDVLDLEPLIRDHLKVPLGKFPFPADPEKQVENALDRVRGFWGDSRFGLFFRAGEKPGEILIYPLGGGCLLRSQEAARSLLFLEAGWFRKPKAAPVCEAIHVCVSMALPLVKAVMLHGVGIRKGGAGHLFLGLPDSGKSTVARFSPPDELISDDGIIVQRGDGGFFLAPAPIDQASPVQGERRRSPAGETKISMGFLLEKDSRVYLERLTPSEVSSIVLKNHVHFFRHFAPDSVKATFGLVSDLCRQVPFYRLHFTRDPSFWSSIESEMSRISPD